MYKIIRKTSDWSNTCGEFIDDVSIICENFESLDDAKDFLDRNRESLRRLFYGFECKNKELSMEFDNFDTGLCIRFGIVYYETEI